MFQTRTLLKLLAILEVELDVNQYVVDRFHFWPALRFFLAVGLQDNNHSKVRQERNAAVERAIDQRFQDLIAKCPPQPDLAPHDLLSRKPTIRARTGQGILVLARPDDHSLKTPLGYYAPVLDPWIQLAQGDQPVFKVELLEQKFNSTQPRHILSLATFAYSASQSGKHNLTERDHILTNCKLIAERAAQWLKSEFGNTLLNFPEFFTRELDALWLDKELYREMLLAMKPALVLTNCYYYRPSLGVVWAARELGIPVADVQHGGNGEYHIGYTHWRHVPAEGYLLLPDYFLVWDSLSANNVLRWLPAQVPHHQPFMAGRFGLRYAKRAALGDSMPSPLEPLIKGSEKVILLTLQSLQTTGLTPLLLEAMRKAPPTWMWLVRGHPIPQVWGDKVMMPDALTATLREAGIARYECHLSTALPLDALLPYVNHHVTGFSGTVQECTSHGIRTTFTHPSVWSFFGNYINLGVATFAETPDDVIRSIADSAPFPDLSAHLAMPRDDETALSVLSQLLTPDGA